jgi:hypothetical protein
VIGLLGMRRVGGLLGSPIPAGGPAGTWTLLGRGSTVIAPGVNTVLSSANIPLGEFPILGTPAANGAGLSTSCEEGTTNAPPSFPNGVVYGLNKVAPFVDFYAFQIRTNLGAAYAFSWGWYKVGP